MKYTFVLLNTPDIPYNHPKVFMCQQITEILYVLPRYLRVFTLQFLWQFTHNLIQPAD